MKTVEFIHRTSKPENPKAGTFYWIEQDSTGSQIWFAPSNIQKELILLNDTGYLTEKDIEDVIKDVEDVKEGLGIVTELVGDPGKSTGIFERLFKLKEEILSQVDETYEKKLTWKVIK